MLFNPKWSETKADPFSLASLIAWLEKQAENKEYNYLSCRGCLLQQYLTACGFKKVYMGSPTFLHAVGEGQSKLSTLPDSFVDVAVEAPHTFGAALDRARKLAGA